MTFTLTPINVKKADGTSTPMLAYNDGTNNAFAHVLLDATGAPVSPATSGNQTTANSTLATIAAQTDGLATAAAQTTANTSLAATATNTGNLDANLGAKADAAAGTDTGTFSLIALVKRALQSLTAIATATQAATPAGTNTIGSVSAAANTSGGTSTYAATGGTGNALLTNTPAAVKSAAGNLYGVSFVNTGSSAAYVQAFDLATGSVTLGTTAPKMVFWVPAGGSWEEKFIDEAKVGFATAITLAATLTATGSAAPAAGLLATVLYK